MNFEVFERARSTSEGRGVPTVRPLSAGRLVLNAAAIRLLGDATHVLLLWDAATKRMGIQPTTADDPNAVRLTISPSQGTITSKAFIVDNGIPHGQRMKLAWDGTMWIASTTDPANPLAAPPEV